MKVSKKKIPPVTQEAIKKSLGMDVSYYGIEMKKGSKPKYWVHRRDASGGIFGIESLEELEWVVETPVKLSDWSIFDNIGNHFLLKIKSVQLGLTTADF